jgi:hypothetical protein
MKMTQLPGGGRRKCKININVTLILVGGNDRI